MSDAPPPCADDGGDPGPAGRLTVMCVWVVRWNELDNGADTPVYISGYVASKAKTKGLTAPLLEDIERGVREEVEAGPVPLGHIRLEEEQLVLRLVVGMVMCVGVVSGIRMYWGHSNDRSYTLNLLSCRRPRCRRSSSLLPAAPPRASWRAACGCGGGREFASIER